MIDNLNKITPVCALPYATNKVALNGTTIDLGQQNGVNSCVFAVTAGAITDGTHTFTLQDSPDGTTWNNVPALYTQYGPNAAAGFTSATTANTTVKIGYLGNNNGGYRYVRLVANGSGTTGGAYSAVAILSHIAMLPAA